MRSLFQRHPRYALFTAFALLATLLLLASQQSPPPVSLVELENVEDDDSLEARLVASELAYQRLLQQRQSLIKEHGPTPDKVQLFPPDREPWPPYTMWDFFPAAFNCPHEVERIGKLGDGGKWVCGLSRVAHKPDCIVYSLGINQESSFEAEILERTSGCQIWGYDFTVTAFSKEVDPLYLHRTHFRPYRVGGANAPAQEPDNVPTYTLASLMQMNGHTHIDILKIDIESWEFDTLGAFVRAYADAGRPLPFGQLQLEVHVWSRKFAEFLKWWEMLEDAGLRPFWTEPNLVYANYNRDAGAELAEYSFLNTNGANDFIMDKHHPAGRTGTGTDTNPGADADADAERAKGVRHGARD